MVTTGLCLTAVGASQPLLNAARLVDAAAQSPPMSSSSSSTVVETEAAHRRRQQAVMKSLKPFVALTGSSGWQQGAAADAAVQKQQVLELSLQCQEQLDR